LWHPLYNRGQRLAAKPASALSAEILVANGRKISGLGGMGAKYYPTIKDQKAGQRFQQKQNQLQKQKKAAAPQTQPVKAEKKK
jgi:hypothetical protein